MKNNLVKTDETTKTIFVGLDVHMKNWFATIIVNEVVKKKTFTANPAKLANYLKENYPDHHFKIGYEAGCFGFWIKCKLDKYENIETLVINPADIPTTDKEKRNKTDKIDSRKIAMTLKAGMVKGIYVPSIKMQEYRSLLRIREALSNKMTRTKNQIKNHLKYFGIEHPEDLSDTNRHWSKNYISWLESVQFESLAGKQTMESLIRELKFFRQEKLTLNRQIRALTKLPEFSENYKILISQPGIGMLGAMTILTEIGEFKRFKNRDHLVSYVGMCPTEHSSGEHRKTGNLNKRQNKRLRKIFIEASWIAVRRDPALGEYYEKSYKNIGKQKAIIKVGKKLISRTRYLILNQQYYEVGVAQ